jgi:hypothetical protein
MFAIVYDFSSSCRRHGQLESADLAALLLSVELLRIIQSLSS